MTMSSKQEENFNNPLVSIVLPVYNVEQYLRTSIESVCGQSYQNIEVILVDDGSTDESGEICDEYATIDKRVRVIHKENGGLSSARNAGIDASKGEYIAFIDSDDYIGSAMINTLLNKMRQNGADLAYCGYMTIEEGREGEAYKTEDRIMTGLEALQTLSGDSGVALGVVWNKLYKKSLFENIRFPLGKYHEDVFVMHLIIDQCKMISAVGDVLYYYRQREGSITKVAYSVRHLDSVEAFYLRYCYYRRKGGWYEELLQKAGEDVATVYYQSKLRFKPNTDQERERVKEIDRMARDICFDRFSKWSPGLKMKLLAPGILAVLSGHKKVYNKGNIA